MNVSLWSMFDAYAKRDVGGQTRLIVFGQDRLHSQVRIDVGRKSVVSRISEEFCVVLEA